MILTGFLLGIIFFLLIYAVIRHTSLLDKYGTSSIHESIHDGHTGQIQYLRNKWAEFFQDEKYKRSVDGLTFRYYGGIWHFEDESKLYWVWEFTGRKPTLDLTYESCWNYFRYDFASMKYIMENHPNLSEKRKHLKAEDKKPVIVNYKDVMNKTK